MKILQKFTFYENFTNKLIHDNFIKIYFSQKFYKNLYFMKILKINTFYESLTIIHFQ